MKYNFQLLSDKLKFIRNAFSVRIVVNDDKIMLYADVSKKQRQFELSFSLIDLIPLLEYINKNNIPSIIEIKNKEIGELIDKAILENKAIFGNLFKFKLVKEGNKYEVK